MQRPAAGASPDTAKYRRDRTTLVLFGGPVEYGFLIYSMSAATELVGRDLAVTKAVAGLHGTLFAVGGIAAGLMAARLVRRFGRRRVIVGGMLGGGLFILALALGPVAGLTLPAAFLAAVCSITGMAASYTAMTAHNGDKAPAALSEATCVAAAVGCLAPLGVSASVGLGWGWRPAMALGALVAFGVAWIVWRTPAEEALDGPEWARLGRAGGSRVGPGPRGGEAGSRTEAVRPASSAKPPGRAVGRGGTMRAFGGFVAANGLSSMAEFGAIFWAGTLLTARTGASPGTAAGSVTAFIAGLTLGRLTARGFALRLGGARLLIAGYCFALAGLAALWTTTSLAVGIAGLALTGFGLGPGYPLTMDLSLRRSPLGMDRSQAVIQTANGCASAVAPFLLGWFADLWGVHLAYLVVPGIVVVAVGAVLFGAGRPSAE
ncbi:MAG: MFS transporter [Bifidobacteriaceae bacterium]|nr:MFS transporter [Bifidobacteriaceae bacterium]